MKRPDNVMTVLSQVLSAIEPGWRASADGRRVLLSGPWKEPRVFMARCSADARWIAETANNESGRPKHLVGLINELDNSIRESRAQKAIKVSGESEADLVRSIRAESVYGMKMAFVSPVALKAHPARMIEGSPIGWARGRWSK